MRSATAAFVVLTGLVLPQAAYAAAGPAVLDLASGTPKELVDKSLGLARSLWVFCFVLGLIIEAFGSSPTGRRDYAGAIWRGVLVLVLLIGYPRIFGSVINLAEGLSNRIAPNDTWSRFADKNAELLKALYSKKSAEDEEAEKLSGTFTTEQTQVAMTKFAGNYLGGMFFDSLLGLFVLIGQASHWVLGALARILSAVYYVLGPLALVFSIPRGSGTGGAWFKSFASVASWPIFSAVILGVTSSFMFRGLESAGFGTAFGAVASALLLAVTALAVPSLAASVVGGGGNFISEGTQVAKRWMPRLKGSFSEET